MAGGSMRDIKRRITSVKNTQQITRAMEMVSAAKLRRAQQSVLAARPFAEKLQEMLIRLARTQQKAGKSLDHQLLSVREVKKVAYVVIAADRGLAGGYNANLIRFIQGVLDEESREYGVIPVGRRVRDYFRNREMAVMAEYVDLGDTVEIGQTRTIVRSLIESYVAGHYDEVYLVYSEFVSVMSQQPTAVKLLPIDDPMAMAGADVAPVADIVESDQQEEEQAYLYEPSPAQVLDLLIPRYVETLVYRAFLEAKASEHGARMTAMRSATDNADEIIKALTLSFNRARQASITTEIAEITGGAEALQS